MLRVSTWRVTSRPRRRARAGRTRAPGRSSARRSELGELARSPGGPGRAGRSAPGAPLALEVGEAGRHVGLPRELAQRLQVGPGDHVGIALLAADDRRVAEVRAHHRPAEAEPLPATGRTRRRGRPCRAVPCRSGKSTRTVEAVPARTSDCLTCLSSSTTPPLSHEDRLSFGTACDRGPSDAYGENIPTGGSPRRSAARRGRPGAAPRTRLLELGGDAEEDVLPRRRRDRARRRPSRAAGSGARP